MATTVEEAESTTHVVKFFLLPAAKSLDYPDSDPMMNSEIATPRAKIRQFSLEVFKNLMGLAAYLLHECIFLLESTYISSPL